MKKSYKKNANLSRVLIPIIAIVIVIVALYVIFSRPGALPGEGSNNPPGGSGPPTAQWNCGDLQIDVNSIKEANTYFRFGLPKPAPSDSKFEILSLTVSNEGTVARDFSGARLELLADGTSYIPVSFSSIEKITLLDGSTMDFPCNESKVASISRLVLEPGESASGCKIYQILSSLEPKTINLIDLSGTKCSVNL